MTRTHGLAAKNHASYVVAKVQLPAFSCCEVALIQGRYKWRHDLRELAQCQPEKRKSSNNTLRDARIEIAFVREGEKTS